MALHPVFLMATGISIAAFLLSWLIRETPLRTGSRSTEAAAKAAVAEA